MNNWTSGPHARKVCPEKPMGLAKRIYDPPKFVSVQAVIPECLDRESLFRFPLKDCGNDKGRLNGYKNSSGFTLIELIMVMAIAGILWVTASPRLDDLPETRARYAIRRVQSDVRYAQLLAMESQSRTRVVFDTGTETYNLQIETSPGTWAAMTNPATKENYTVTFNTGDFTGVDVTKADFNGNTTVIFDSLGIPFDGSGQPLVEPAEVELNALYQLRFRAPTGKVDIVTL